jgi:opacity protein-like surface antigen
MKIHVIRQISASLIALSIAGGAQATESGFYFGTMLGQTNLHSPTQTAVVPNTAITIGPLTPQKTGIGLRLFMGGNYSRYVAMETGYTYYQAVTYKSDGFTNSLRTKLNSLDLLGKLMYPISTTGIGIFGKFGIAYVNARTTGKVNGFAIKSETSSTVRPVLGIGASYDLTQRWVMDLSYTRLMYKTSYVKNPDMIALGISYHIVDEMCGQFLC